MTTLLEALKAYKKKFGDSPAIFGRANEDVGLVEIIMSSIETDTPLVENVDHESEEVV